MPRRAYTVQIPDKTDFRHEARESAIGASPRHGEPKICTGGRHAAEANLEKGARECARDARVACSSVGHHTAATVMAVDSVAEATEAAAEAVIMVAARVVVVMVAAGTVRVLHCTSTVDDLTTREPG